MGRPVYSACLSRLVLTAPLNWHIKRLLVLFSDARVMAEPATKEPFAVFASQFTEVLVVFANQLVLRILAELAGSGLEGAQLGAAA